MDDIEQQMEDDTNALIEVIWPMLDAGMSKETVIGLVHNALDAWSPNARAPNEITRARARKAA